MRFKITLHIDVPDGTETDAFEMRGWFEEHLETLNESVEDEFTTNVVSCEEVEDVD